LALRMRIDAGRRIARTGFPQSKRQVICIVG